MKPTSRLAATTLAATALAAAALVAPAAAVRLDLEQAVDAALAGNPALAAVAETRRQLAGAVAEARADAFPQLSLASSWGQSRSPALLNSPDFEEILGQFPGASFEPRTQELSRAMVEVKQTVWNFGKVGAAIELARIASRAAEAQIDTARLDTAFETAQAYFQVLAARDGLTTLQADREFRRRDLERVRALLEIGEATELERLRAEAALAEVEPEVALREGQVTVAENSLRRLLALPAGEPLELAGAPGTLPDPPELDRLVELGLATRPELADLAYQVQAREKQKTVTRADGLPQIDFAGSWGREVRRIENFDDPLYSTWSFGVSLRWSLLDGGRRRGQVAQVESQRQQTALRLEDLRARVRLEVGQQLSDYRTARARSVSAAAATAVAQEALRVARESYEQGIVNQTDLLDAQSRATLADTVAIATHYEALIQASRLARAVGRLATAPWRPLSEN